MRRRSVRRWRPWPTHLARTTGLPLDPYFAAPKMAWLRRHVTSEGVVTTSDAWLVHRLTGSFVTDATTASRTLLLDLETRAWSEEACAAFGLDGDGPPHGRRQRAGDRPDGCVRSVAPAERAQRRSTGGAGRGALPRAGRVEVHLRNGRLPPGQRRASAVRLLERVWPYRWPGSSATRPPTASTVRSMPQEPPLAWLQRWGFLRRAQDLDGVAGSVHDSGGVSRGARPQRPGCALVASRRPGQHRGDRPRHRARPCGPGHHRRFGGAGDPAGTRAAAADLGRPLALLRVDGGLTRFAGAHADAG